MLRHIFPLTQGDNSDGQTICSVDFRSFVYVRPE